MEYEFVALTWPGDCVILGLPGYNPPFADIKTYKARMEFLQKEGYEVERKVYWHPCLGSEGIGVCIMRRLKGDPHKLCRSRDEPRKWTEGEIQKIAVMSQPGPRADGGWLGPPRSGSVVNERAMQADLCGRLERRNAELQEAIDAVVETYESVAYKLDPVCRSIKEHLYPLVTKKEESNG